MTRSKSSRRRIEIGISTHISEWPIRPGAGCGGGYSTGGRFTDGTHVDLLRGEEAELARAAKYSAFADVKRECPLEEGAEAVEDLANVAGFEEAARVTDHGEIDGRRAVRHLEHPHVVAVLGASRHAVVFQHHKLQVDVLHAVFQVANVNVAGGR